MKNKIQSSRVKKLDVKLGKPAQSTINTKIPQSLINRFFNEKKALIIAGEARTGKSRLAKELMKFYEETKFINGFEVTNGNVFIFQACTPKTDLIIVDDCPDNFNFLSFVQTIKGNLVVRKKLQANFEIQPKFIFVVEKAPDIKHSQSLNLYFDIFDFRVNQAVVKALWQNLKNRKHD